LNSGGLSEGLDTFLGIEVSFMSLDARPHGMKIHKFENFSRALQSPIFAPIRACVKKLRLMGEDIDVKIFKLLRIACRHDDYEGAHKMLTCGIDMTD
jgi:hypothetical protein